MGDMGDLWRTHKNVVGSRVKKTRERRLEKFHRHLDSLRDFADHYGVEIRNPDRHHHFQFKCREYLANYYPSTGRFVLQKPILRTVPRRVQPEHSLLVFLRYALAIEAVDEDFFMSWWFFGPNNELPDEVRRIGEYVMPEVRKEILRLGACDLDFIDSVSPREFEHLVAKLLRERGFETCVTPASGDGGKDIIALRNSDGDEHVLLVECKRWLVDNVGIDVVQRAIGVKHIDKADASMVVTTAKFTGPAMAEAKKVVGEISLVDRDGLKAWLVSYSRGKSGENSGE